MKHFWSGFEKQASMVARTVTGFGHRMANAGAKLLPHQNAAVRALGKGTQAVGNAVAKRPIATALGATGTAGFAAGRLSKQQNGGYY